VPWTHAGAASRSSWGSGSISSTATASSRTQARSHCGCSSLRSRARCSGSASSARPTSVASGRTRSGRRDQAEGSSRCLRRSGPDRAQGALVFDRGTARSGRSAGRLGGVRDHPRVDRRPRRDLRDAGGAAMVGPLPALVRARGPRPSRDARRDRRDLGGTRARLAPRAADSSLAGCHCTRRGRLPADRALGAREAPSVPLGELRLGRSSSSAGSGRRRSSAGTSGRSPTSARRWAASRCLSSSRRTSTSRRSCSL
jgi:hypothetical protein